MSLPVATGVSAPEPPDLTAEGRQRRPPSAKQVAWRKQFGKEYGAVSKAWKSAQDTGRG